MTAARSTLLWRLAALAAVAGALISAYLTATHWSDQPVICAGLGSCATVQSSDYATVAGVPVALLGLVMYAALAACALLAPRNPTAALAAFGIALAGTLYSGYLTWVELGVLQAICLWCVGSALAVTAAAGASVAALRGS
jgi:uncharacterized membrane protein